MELALSLRGAGLAVLLRKDGIKILKCGLKRFYSLKFGLYFTRFKEALALFNLERGAFKYSNLILAFGF